MVVVVVQVLAAARRQVELRCEEQPAIKSNSCEAVCTLQVR